jgi:hypothetical protein
LSVTRRETWILRGFAVWVTYEWLTLLWNVWHDHAAGQGLGFKLVHTVLAVITIAFAVVAWRAVSAIRSRHLLSPEPRSARREAAIRRRAAFRSPEDSSAAPGPTDVVPDPLPQGAGHPT